MIACSGRFPLVVQSLLALVLALNALGWAAHVDMPEHAVDGQFAHSHAGATTQQPGDEQGDIAYSSDHCGHADAHFTALLGVIVPLPAPCAAPLAPRRVARYTSVASPPPVEPPIA